MELAPLISTLALILIVILGLLLVVKKEDLRLGAVLVRNDDKAKQRD